MAAASSSPKWEADKHLKDAGVKEYFVDIVCGDMIENSKPAPDIYLKACKIIGAAPENGPLRKLLMNTRNALIQS